MIVAAGLIVGRLYDRGYLYVCNLNYHPTITFDQSILTSSYHLLWGGSILESFALFMHSLAKPGAYYQVCVHKQGTFQFTQIAYAIPDTPQPRYCLTPRPRDALHSHPRRDLALLSETARSCDDDSRHRLFPRSCRPSHYAQQPPQQPICRVRYSRTRERRHDLWSAVYCMLVDAHEASALRPGGEYVESRP